MENDFKTIKDQYLDFEEYYKLVFDEICNKTCKKMFESDEYVGFKTAKRLKVLGYNIPCNSVYNTKCSLDFFSNDNIADNWNDKGEHLYSAPTLTEAEEWLIRNNLKL